MSGRGDRGAHSLVIGHQRRLCRFSGDREAILQTDRASEVFEARASWYVRRMQVVKACCDSFATSLCAPRGVAAFHIERHACPICRIPLEMQFNWGEVVAAQIAR